MTWRQRALWVAGFVTMAVLPFCGGIGLVVGTVACVALFAWALWHDLRGGLGL